MLTVTIDSLEDKNPLAFISYSWDSPEHKTWVLKLADLLVLNGVDVLLDQYELGIGKNMYHFMEQSVSRADKVLMLFTENYAKKADKKIGGVGFEYSIITPELYSTITNNSKFLPILCNGEIDKSVPSFIRNLLLLDMRNQVDFDNNLVSLLKVIYGVPVVIKPKLGRKPDLDFKNVITSKSDFSYPTEIKLLEDYNEQTQSYKKELDLLKSSFKEESKRKQDELKVSKTLSEKEIKESERILQEYNAIMDAGKNNEVDYLMSQLNSTNDFRVMKSIDAALSMTNNSKKIISYLFNGSKIQRNYATLYLKRSNQFGPLQEAVHKGLIDRIQAFSK